MPHRVSRFALSIVFISVALTGAEPAAMAAPMDVTLAFSSLPSTQGFAYVASGSHAGVPEATVFSVSGGVLTQNSIGLSNGASGGGIIYQRIGGLTTTETKQMTARARCLAAEASANAPSGEGGFYFGFATGSVQYGFGLTPARIFVLQPAGTVLIPGTFDNTQFHDYVFSWSPPGTFQIHRDNVLVHSGSGGFALAVNRVFLGDGTGGANALGETSYFRFVQDVATSSATSTWGRVKSLYR